MQKIPLDLCPNCARSRSWEIFTASVQTWASLDFLRVSCHSGSQSNFCHAFQYKGHLLTSLGDGKTFRSGKPPNFPPDLCSARRFHSRHFQTTIVSFYKKTKHTSSRNRLPFMILNPPELNCRKMGFPVFSCRKVHFPTERCTFLQRNAFSCRKMRFLGGTGQETAGGSQGSRIKNATQLSQEYSSPKGPHRISRVCISILCVQLK